MPTFLPHVQVQPDWDEVKFALRTRSHHNHYQLCRRHSRRHHQSLTTITNIIYTNHNTSHNTNYNHNHNHPGIPVLHAMMTMMMIMTMLILLQVVEQAKQAARKVRTFRTPPRNPPSLSHANTQAVTRLKDADRFWLSGYSPAIEDGKYIIITIVVVVIVVFFLRFPMSPSFSKTSLHAHR